MPCQHSRQHVSLIKIQKWAMQLIDNLQNNTIVKIQHGYYFCFLFLFVEETDPKNIVKPILNSVLAVFSSRSFMVSSLTFKSFDLIFVSVVRKQSSFQSLIDVDRTSSIMLNKSDKSAHPCFVSELKGNAFSISLLSMMLAVGL